MYKNNLIATLFILCITTPLSLFSNDGGYTYNPQTGSAYAVNNVHIRIEEERVIFKDGKCTAEFIFKNHSNKKQRVTIGFPVESVYSVDDQPMIDSYSRWSYNFETTVNGRKKRRSFVPIVKDENMPECSYAFLSTLRFKPHETLTVVNSYNVDPIESYTGASEYFYHYRYIVTTGRTWKGTIGKALFRFYFKIGRQFIMNPDGSAFVSGSEQQGDDYRFGIDQYVNVISKSKINRIYKEGQYLVAELYYEDFIPEHQIETLFYICRGTKPQYNYMPRGW